MFSSSSNKKYTLNVQFLWIIWTSMLIIGLLFSKFLITLSIIFAFTWGLVAFIKKSPRCPNWYKNPIFVSLTGIYILMLLGSIWNMQDIEELTTRLRVNLAFICLPIAWAMLPRIEIKTIIWIIKIFLALITLALIGIFINYLLNFESITDSLNFSKAIPVPNKDHIRFNLLVCLGFYAAIWLGWTIKEKKYYFLAVFMAIALHILAVRSGLLSFYSSLFLIGGYGIVYYKKYVLGLISLALIIILPYITYNHIPSLKKKIELTVHNINMLQNGVIDEYSDTQRFLSYKIAWQIFEESPLIGIGIGNIKKETTAIYMRDYPNQQPMMPHNLYLTFLAGVGIVGLVIFICLLLYPLFFKTYRQPLIFAFYIIFGISFLVENTIFVSLGSNMFVYFLLLFGNIATLERKSIASIKVE